MKHHALSFLQLGKVSQKLLSAEIVIGTLRVNPHNVEFGYLYPGIKTL